ncbi:MAG: thioredoxin family protein [Pseudomonadales bacterium]|nr:thioredoxin family protein [Pseudomonadales bacterium]NRA14769.1 thioredoxin family protein [Oceanospirillaceae bacterium]
MLLETPRAQIGWNARPFTLSDPDGNSYKLSDLQAESGLLIAFICNHCPYVLKIIDRLVNDAKLLQAEGINVVAISSNDYRYVAEDSPDMMKKFAIKHGFTFPYLVDKDQSVAQMYGAVCTPDFFGFNRAGELQYRGRLDDAIMGDPIHRKTELLDGMRQIAKTGYAPDIQHPSIGCSIKWK